MSKYKDYSSVIKSTKDVASELLVSLHGDNIEYSDKQDIVTNIEFEARIPSIKKNFFHQRMVEFANKLDSSDQKYQTNGIVRDENYKGKFLFAMKYFLSFGRDYQSVYLMSTILLKYSIDRFCVPQYQLTYIDNTALPTHKQSVKLCC